MKVPIKRGVTLIICIILIFSVLLIIGQVYRVRNNDFYSQNQFKVRSRMYSDFSYKFSCCNGKGLFYYDVKEKGVVLEYPERRIIIPVADSIFHSIGASSKYVYFSTEKSLYQYDLEGNLVAKNDMFKGQGVIQCCGCYLFLPQGNPRFWGIVSAENVSECIPAGDISKQITLVDEWQAVVKENRSFNVSLKRSTYYFKQYEYDSLKIFLATKKDIALQIEPAEKERELVTIYDSASGNDYCNVVFSFLGKDGEYRLFGPDSHDEVFWFSLSDRNCIRYRGGKHSNVTFISEKEEMVTNLPIDYDGYNSKSWFMDAVQFTGQRLIFYGRKYRPDEADKEFVTTTYFADHIGDYICVIDLDSKTLLKKKPFKKEEYVLYADEAEYIVYKDDSLQFFDIDTDRLLKTEELPTFQDEYTYTFERCGEEVFLFEQKGVWKQPLLRLDVNDEEYVKLYPFSRPELLQRYDLHPQK